MESTKKKNDILSSISTSVMQSTKDRPPAAQSLGLSVSNSNISRSVHSSSTLAEPEDKPRIRHASRNEAISSIPKPREMNKPILEGLDKAPSAYISMNGSGYDSPRLRSVRQQSQNLQKVDTSVGAGIGFSNSNFRSSSLKDYTYGMSKDKLQV